MPPPLDAGAVESDAGVGFPDAGPDGGGATPVDGGADAGMLGTDAGVLPCVEDNSPAAIAARDGFIHVCADPTAMPNVVCGDGSPYRMSYRPATGASQGLLLYFRGGGGCSDYVACWGVDGRGGMGRRVGTMENTRNTEPPLIPGLGRTVGIFDRLEQLNTLRQYDQVFIAYCTGDVGQGTTRQVLQRPPEALPTAPASIETFFHGEYDVRFALDVAKDRFPNPQRIVMYGTSAGALSSTNALPWVVTTFGLGSTSQLSLVTEGGMALGRPSQDALLQRVLADYRGTMGRPFVRVGQFSFISDPTQMSFSPPPLTTPAPFQAELRRVSEERIAMNPTSYRAFTPDGACHTVAQSPGLFAQFEPGPNGVLRLVQPVVRPNPDLTIGSVSFDAWVGRIIGGAGPMDSTIPSLAGSWATVATSCRLPGSN
ncbi:MAG: hypothetical protein Q8S33_32650 [Myxococcales bacterium]|nr:hypothetical protein [Myxococcales bacterium]